MHNNIPAGVCSARVLIMGSLGLTGAPVAAAVHIDGQVVQAGGGCRVRTPLCALWAATANAPARLAQTETGADGGFVISSDQSPSSDTCAVSSRQRRGTPEFQAPRR